MRGDIIGGNLEACHPQSAERLSGEFFRFLFHGNTAASWKSRLELGRDLTDDKCREAAVSLMTSSNAVEKSKKRHPAFKKKMVARIKIEESHGLVETVNFGGHYIEWSYYNGALGLVAGTSIDRILAQDFIYDKDGLRVKTIQWPQNIFPLNSTDYRSYVIDGLRRLKSVEKGNQWDPFQNSSLQMDGFENYNGGSSIDGTILGIINKSSRNQIASVNSVAYSYDIKGNLTYDGVYRYDRDVWGRIVKVSNDFPTSNLSLYNGVRTCP